MRRILIAAPFVPLVFAACTRAEKAPPAEAPAARPEPAVSALEAPDAGLAAATVKPAPARDLGAWASDWPKSWTDPRVVAVLADDCSFVPVRPRSGDQGPGEIPADIFTCSLGYSQSCTMDPCIIPSSACETKCTGTCDDCGGACVKSCAACKGACTDETCKRACATTCGECKQTCTRTMDRCVTGECAKVHEACNGRLRAMWSRSGCTARCAAHAKCNEKCGDAEACRERCDENVAPGFKACNAKCDELRSRAAGADGSAPDGNAPERCLLRCYETVPCSPFLCQGWSPAR